MAAGVVSVADDTARRQAQRGTRQYREATIVSSDSTRPGGPAQRNEPQTATRDTRRRPSHDDRFNSKLREAFGASPFILTKFDTFMDWIRSSSMFWLQFGIACCSIELMHTAAVKHDFDRFGTGVPRSSPRQADLLIIPGTVVSKFAPRMKRIYDQMPEPKFVVGMGSCTISGGPFQSGYNVVKGAEEIVPVDIHVPGCPPRPEALVYGIAKLQERIANGERSPVVVKPYELQEFADLDEDEVVEKLAEQIDEEELVMRYNWADSP